VEPRILRQVFFLGSAGVCLLFGLVLRAPVLLTYPVAVFLLVALARASASRRLSRLRASRSVGSSAFEDDVVRAELAVENHGRAPVSLVEITDAFGPALADRKALLDAGPLPPRRRHRLAYRSACSRLWGVYTVGPLTLSVSDALGLFSVRRILPDIRPFDLFPRAHSVGGLDRLAGRRSFAPSELSAAQGGQSAAYLGVREFRSGDDVRRVHWPATARHAVPMVKEYELDLTPYFTLFLDLERRHRAGTGRKSTHEYVVRTGASLLASAARRGDTVRLVGLPVGLMLIALALVVTLPGDSSPDASTAARGGIDVSAPEVEQAYQWLILLALVGASSLTLAFRLLTGRGEDARPLIEMEETHVEAEEVLEVPELDDPRYAAARGRVIRAYVRFLTRARRRGLRLEPFLTPKEIERRVRRPEGPLEVLTGLFMDARYGPDEPGEETVRRAGEASRAVIDSLRRRRRARKAASGRSAA